MASENEEELRRLMGAHELSVANLVKWKRKFRQGEPTGISLLKAIANEAAKRQQLLDWNAPTVGLATLKLLHLLAQVLAADIPFDEASLAAVLAEVSRFRSGPPDER